MNPSCTPFAPPVDFFLACDEWFVVDYARCSSFFTKKPRSLPVADHRSKAAPMISPPLLFSFRVSVSFKSASHHDYCWDLAKKCPQESSQWIWSLRSAGTAPRCPHPMHLPTPCKLWGPSPRPRGWGHDDSLTVCWSGQIVLEATWRSCPHQCPTHLV